MGDRQISVKVTEGVLPPKIDPTSIDLRLDHIDEAKIWDIKAYDSHVGVTGEQEPILHVGSLRYKIGDLTKFLISPPECDNHNHSYKVYRQRHKIFVRTGGFLLWQTKEIIGTPDKTHASSASSTEKARGRGQVCWYI